MDINQVSNPQKLLELGYTQDILNFFDTLPNDQQGPFYGPAGYEAVLRNNLSYDKLVAMRNMGYSPQQIRYLVDVTNAPSNFDNIVNNKVTPDQLQNYAAQQQNATTVPTVSTQQSQYITNQPTAQQIIATAPQTADLSALTSAQWQQLQTAYEQAKQTNPSLTTDQFKQQLLTSIAKQATTPALPVVSNEVLNNNIAKLTGGTSTGFKYNVPEPTFDGASWISQIRQSNPSLTQADLNYMLSSAQYNFNQMHDQWVKDKTVAQQAYTAQQAATPAAQPAAVPPPTGASGASSESKKSLLDPLLKIVDPIVKPVQTEVDKLVKPAQSEVDKLVKPAQSEVDKLVKSTQSELDKDLKGTQESLNGLFDGLFGGSGGSTKLQSIPAPAASAFVNPVLSTQKALLAAGLNGAMNYQAPWIGGYTGNTTGQGTAPGSGYMAGLLSQSGNNIQQAVPQQTQQQLLQNSPDAQSVMQQSGQDAIDRLNNGLPAYNSTAAQPAQPAPQFAAQPYNTNTGHDPITPTYDPELMGNKLYDQTIPAPTLNPMSHAGEGGKRTLADGTESVVPDAVYDQWESLELQSYVNSLKNNGTGGTSPWANTNLGTAQPIDMTAVKQMGTPSISATDVPNATNYAATVNGPASGNWIDQGAQSNNVLKQNDLNSKLFDTINNLNAPSVAQQQLKQTTQSNLANAYALAASGRGSNVGLNQREAYRNVGSINQQANAQAGIQRAQEIQAAQGLLSSNLTSARGQDIQMATAEGQLKNQTAITDAQYKQQALQQQQQQMYDRLIKNASLTQESNQAYQQQYNAALSTNADLYQKKLLAQGQLNLQQNTANQTAQLQGQQMVNQMTQYYISAGLALDQAQFQAQQDYQKLVSDQNIEAIRAQAATIGAQLQSRNQLAAGLLNSGSSSLAALLNSGAYKELFGSGAAGAAAGAGAADGAADGGGLSLIDMWPSLAAM